jgi:hypothetical protein
MRFAAANGRLDWTGPRGRRGVVATAERGQGEGRFLVVRFGFGMTCRVFLLLGRVAITVVFFFFESRVAIS